MLSLPAGVSVAIDEGELFARGPVAVFRWRNAEGWPVEFASANVLQLCGRSTEDFVEGGLAYASLVHPDDIGRVGIEVADAVASEASSFEHEPYRVCHPDGSVRWLHDTTHLMWDDGLVTHFIGYVIDITARVEAETRRLQLERQLLHAQKLESLGVLAGGVAHDFNNLLTGVLGEAYLARLGLASGDGAGAEHLDRIEALALQAAELTGQLLAYSGKGRFVVQPLDLSDTVREMASMLSVVTSKKSELRLDLQEGLPAIEADRAQVRQVLMNLITNASDALDDEVGTISIRTGLQTLSGEDLGRGGQTDALAPGNYVAVQVSDTGTGMSPEVQEQLFEPFFTTKALGRGLGMSAVQGIVRSHHGAIRVSSEVGKGSSFELWFPASSKAAVVHAPPAAQSAWRGKGVVLVVDDEVSVRRVAGAMLETFGFSTLQAADGAEAVEIYLQHADDVVLVLLDMMMPVMGGMECLEALRRVGFEGPVLLTSGFDEQESMHQLMARGATTFIQKPYSLDGLRRAARAALEPETT